GFTSMIALARDSDRALIVLSNTVAQVDDATSRLLVPDLPSTFPIAVTGSCRGPEPRHCILRHCHRLGGDAERQRAGRHQPHQYVAEPPSEDWVNDLRHFARAHR